MRDFTHHIPVEVRTQDLITAVKSEIFKAVTVENGAFHNVTPCSLVEEY